MRIEEKQRCLQEKAFQLLAIMNLINRNKEKSELENQKEEECDHDSNDENTQSSSWSMSQVAQSKNNEKITKPIQIPFLVVMGTSEEDAVRN